MAGVQPTIADVARAAGVSKSAVSFALNGRDGVSVLTRDRILAVALDLGWQPSHRARSLSVSRALAFGMVVARPPELVGADPFFPSFIAGVETMLAPAGYALVLQMVPAGPAEEASYRRLAGEGRVDGVFLSDLRTNDPRIALLQQLRLPAVTLNRPDIASPFPAVCVDDQAGITQAVEHLVKLGHVWIAHVAGPPEFLHASSRRAAWASALEEAGLEPGPVLVSDFTATGGSAATRQLLEARTPPTAIVYANDLMAIAGLAAAQRNGVRVPDDVSITGFDGVELASYVHPPLTTVVTDPFSWGRSAAAVLLATVGAQQPVAQPSVAQPPAVQSTTQSEPPWLRIQGSTAPAAVRTAAGAATRSPADRAASAARVSAKEK